MCTKCAHFSEQFDDDLTRELRDCDLDGMEEVIGVLSSSTDAFLKVPPDYNACLTDVRVALQTVAKSISIARRSTDGGSFDETKWGQVLSFLRKSTFLTQNEEEGISGVFTFVSTGAHTPLGLSEQEMARLGRGLTIGMIYFLVKRYNRS